MKFESWKRETEKALGKHVTAEDAWKEAFDRAIWIVEEEASDYEYTSKMSVERLKRERDE